MKKNKILSIILAASLLPFSALPVSAADINILINGKPVEFTEDSGKPFVDENSRTMVPLRVTMEAAGAAVGYDAEKKTAIVVTVGSRIEVPVGQSYLYDNNNKIANDTSAVIKDSRIYLPIRAVLEAAEFTVEWDNQTKTVSAYNTDYDCTDFVPYDAGDIGTLLNDVLNGNVVYINGSYYATPEYIRMVDKIEYTNEDLNKAIYPQQSRYSLADAEIIEVPANWVTEGELRESGVTFNSYALGETMPKGFMSISPLTGTVKGTLYEMPSLPDDFATSPTSGTYDGIQIKVENGKVSFLQADLISHGVVNEPINGYNVKYKS